ncbi:hypothetical protein DV735_g2866, partial [Chaetothyriales sp. CBS 134920]
MFAAAESPPPLQHSPSLSDQSHFHSRETTPATPVSQASSAGRRTDKTSLPWVKKLVNTGKSTTGLSLVDARLQPDLDNSFPLFGASPPGSRMAGPASPPVPISITPRESSGSPPRGNQPSNLTSALQRGTGTDSSQWHALNMQGPQAVPQPPHNAYSDVSQLKNGTQPISVNGKANSTMRRESLAQSLGTGMSWGGVSVGSWIRDDMMMSGTSPFTFQSPSYHSSSYLPKLEANFMKDFSCCGLTLPTLHDLLQHYEEAHAQKEPVSSHNIQRRLPDTRAALAATTANQVQHEAQQRQLQYQGGFGASAQNQSQIQQQTQEQMQQLQQQLQQTQQQPPQGPAPQRTGFSSTLQTIPDMDTVEDMEMYDMDESTPPSNLYTRSSATASPQAQFASIQQPQIPQLNTTMMQSHQAFRQSAPTTPITSARNPAFQTNSATLSANPMQQFQDLQQPYRPTPDSSAPGSPGELDESGMSGMDDMSMDSALFAGLQNGFGHFGGYGNNSDMIDLYIDEPARKLFQQSRASTSQGAVHQRLGSGQYGPNSEIAKTIRERQVAAGLPDTTKPLLPYEEPKPFRCPVIGCEKAYKNQNGLKYHKTHGHNSQRLHENGDGTFSIVNPDTQAPYPGTQGMEKEKPYKCEVCQKRYKNLNGLKYHKTHSPACNPELLQNNANRLAALNPATLMPGTTPDPSASVAPGLLSDQMMM